MTENTEVGKVKFFDHKKGYGFVEVINPESKLVNTEHFLHYSEIKCDSNFKKVIPGEIVSMTVAPKEGEEGKTVCKNLCGLFGSKLLIDSDQYTYRIRSKGSNHNNDDEDEQDTEEVENSGN